MDTGTNSECPACGSSRRSADYTVPDYEYGLSYRAAYLSCEDCGTTAQAPMPSPAQLAAFYPPAYHSHTNRGLLHRLRCRMRLRQLLPLPLKDGVVLDFGCGNGAFLEYAAHRLPGVRFFGYEIGPKQNVTVRRQGRITLVEGALEDLLDRLPACRLISMNHVIEHLPDPQRALSALSGMLLPGGALVGQTPAAGSCEHRMFGPRWSGYHAPRHTIVFSRRGLRECLTRLGFQRIRISSAFNPAGLAVSLASAVSSEPVTGIPRQGIAWLGWLAAGTWLAPFDLLSGRSGIMNFRAEKTETHSP